MLTRPRSYDRDLWLIYLSLFLWGFGLFLYLFLQPLYITQLGATPQQVGITLGVGSFIVAFLYAPIGLWADRRGRKGVILTGFWMGALSAFGMAVAPDWRWFIPAMAIYTFSNFAGSVMNGYIASKVAASRRGEVYAFTSTGPAIGSILAPAIGGWIGDHFGLRMVYVCAAIFFCLSALAMCFIRPQPAEPKATSATAVNLMREAPFLWHIVVMFLIFFAVDLGQVLTPKYLGEVRGLTVEQIGWLGSASAAGVVILLMVVGRLPSMTRLPMLLPQGLVLVALLLLLLAPGMPLLLLAYFVSGSNRLIRSPSLARMSNLLTPATMSFGLGIYQTALQFGYSVSPFVAGLLYEKNPIWPIYAGVIGLVVTLGLTFTLSSLKRDP